MQFEEIKDKRKHHGAVDKFSLEQQFRNSDAIILIVWKKLEF